MNYLYKTCLKEKAIAAKMPGCMFGGKFMPEKVCPKQWQEYNEANKDCNEIKEAMMALKPR
jgi:hypothetical protein